MNQVNSTFSVIRNISTPSPLSSEEDSQAKARQKMFGVIAVLSFLLNFLFCVIMMRKPAMMKKPHNILLFSLAITDLLTGLLELIKIYLKFSKKTLFQCLFLLEIKRILQLNQSYRMSKFAS